MQVSQEDKDSVHVDQPPLVRMLQDNLTLIMEVIGMVLKRYLTTQDQHEEV